MAFIQRAIHGLLRILLFLVPITALVVVGFAGYSFVSAQLADVPEPSQASLLRPASEQPLDLSPATLETRLLGLYLRFQNQALETPAGSDPKLITFRIQSGDTALSVSERLKEEGLISDTNLFRQYMRYQGLD